MVPSSFDKAINSGSPFPDRASYLELRPVACAELRGLPRHHDISTSDWRAVDVESTTLVFAWYAVCASMRSVSSVARSTFDPSTAPPWRDPRPFVPGSPSWALPEAAVGVYSPFPTSSNPCGFANCASAMVPSVWLSPLEYVPVIAPLAPIEYESSVPAAYPSWEVTAMVWSAANWVTAFSEPAAGKSMSGAAPVQV